MNYERESVVVSALAPAYAAALSEARAALKGHEPCAACGERIAVKTDGQARPVCGRCAAETTDQYRHAAPRVGRNAPCPCNSGKKFKACCLQAK